MTDFETRVSQAVANPLCAVDLATLQANLGLLCNQSCAHCHLACSPDRTEIMGRAVMEAILAAADAARPALVDLSGGAPELNPDFRWFVAALVGCGHRVQVRTNLTALLEPGQETTPDFLRERAIDLVASMPCYLEENVDAARGAGAYTRSVEALRRLNALGYGADGGGRLRLVFNPAGPDLPPEASELEDAYRGELDRRLGIRFTDLIAITNMPIGRFAAHLERTGRADEYAQLLEESYNPETLPALMCRHQVSIGWDGTLFDCDFNLALGLPVVDDAPQHIAEFDAPALADRAIATGPHCYGCTAGRGSSCAGELV